MKILWGVKILWGFHKTFSSKLCEKIEKKTSVSPARPKDVAHAGRKAGAAAAGGAEQRGADARCVAALASTPKASRKRGDALPPPARSELTPNGHHVEHMMDAETPGGQHHGESSYM